MIPHNIVVVGGVAAGASFAARARRLNEFACITLIERGPDVSFANCGLPYYVGGEIPERAALAVQTPQSLEALLNLEVRTRCEASAIDRAGKRVEMRDLKTNTTQWIPYDKLMLAPGAAPIWPDLPGIQDPRILSLRNLQDMDRIVAACHAAKRALVIGAGFIGLEMAEQLRRAGLQVDLLEMQGQVLPSLDASMAAPLEKALVRHGIGVRLGDAALEFIATPEQVTCQLRSGRQLAADIVILAIGVKPESGLAAKAGLQLGARGHIVVDEFQRSSDPDIYAAGDVAETRDRVLGQPINIPLGGPANRQGRVAADHIFMPESARPYPGSLGTAIVRVFEMAAGSTGWSEKQLERIGHPYHAVTVNDYHHAAYYPGATPIMLKILWEPDSGRLLGAQASGENGVDKRLDVLATAIAGGMTVEQLCHLELAYSPPFGAAKDIINIVGFAACNRRDGLVAQVSTLPEDPLAQLLDVRPQAVAAADPLGRKALNIPFASLRANLHQLDRQRPIVTLCAMGKTSYFAARVLAQQGFMVSSLSGGLRALRQNYTAT